MNLRCDVGQSFCLVPILFIQVSLISLNNFNPFLKYLEVSLNEVSERGMQLIDLVILNSSLYLVVIQLMH